MDDDSVVAGLMGKGITRRDFMKFCTAMAAALALPSTFIPEIAKALENNPKPILVWLEFQDCAGNTEALLRISKPKIADLILDILSVDYHETIMAPAGKQAEKSLLDVVNGPQKGKYLVVIEGSIPQADGGVYCTIAGRTGIDIAKEVCGNALATLAIGTCAAYGGIPKASPNPTGAVGAQDIVSGTVINLPGCPANAENISATIVHYLTFGAMPPVDAEGRPLFAYGKRIHDNCERRAHFDAGQYVREWGDEGHRQGWCLYHMGCKGPETFMNCPVVRYNEGTSWPIGAGHGCIGCAQPDFWDEMTPFYKRLPEDVPGFGVEESADKIGMTVAGVTAAGVAAHAVVSSLKKNGDKSEEQ